MQRPNFVTMMILKAQHLMKSLGARTAAGYLRNRGFSLGEALDALNMPNRYQER